MEYSQKKFSRFSAEKKIRVVSSFLEQIIEKWDSFDEREKLKVSLVEVIDYLEHETNPDLHTLYVNKVQINEQQELAGFLEHTLFFLEKYSRGVKDADIFTARKTSIVSSTPQKILLYALLDNIRSTFNVGSMIRTSECFGLKKLYFCGYTPTPNNPKVKKTALDTELLIDWEQELDSIELINRLKLETPELTIIALETDEKAESIYNFNFPEPALIIVGNEAKGVSKELLSIADKIVKIPLMGNKESFNVGVAFGIACYEISRQWNTNKTEEFNDNSKRS